MSTIVYPGTTPPAPICSAGCDNPHCSRRKKPFNTTYAVSATHGNNAQPVNKGTALLLHNNFGTSNDPYAGYNDIIPPAKTV